LTTGAVVSNVNVSEAVPVLPARSVSLTTMVCTPSTKLPGVNTQMPPLSAVVVPSVVVPSLSVTNAFGSPAPVNSSFEVILSVDDEPASLNKRSVGVGLLVSSVKVSEAVLVLPSALISLATIVCEPFARPVGVNAQVPPLLTEAVLVMDFPSTIK
jgi:hypothetical protein